MTETTEEAQTAAGTAHPLVSVSTDELLRRAGLTTTESAETVAASSQPAEESHAPAPTHGGVLIAGGSVTSVIGAAGIAHEFGVVPMLATGSVVAAGGAAALIARQRAKRRTPRGAAPSMGPAAGRSLLGRKARTRLASSAATVPTSGGRLRRARTGGAARRAGNAGGAAGSGSGTNRSRRTNGTGALASRPSTGAAAARRGGHRGASRPRLSRTRRAVAGVRSGGRQLAGRMARAVRATIPRLGRAGIRLARGMRAAGPRAATFGGGAGRFLAGQRRWLARVAAHHRVPAWVRRAAAVVGGATAAVLAISRWIARRRAVARWLAGETADSEPEATTSTTPEILPGRSTPRPGDTSTTKEISTVSSAIEAVVEAITTHIGGFEPQNVADLEAFLEGLTSVFEAQAGSFATLSERWREGAPISEAVLNHLQEMGSACATLTNWAEETVSLYRLAHTSERDRLENQRPGEEFWDVSQQ